jgi:hypothetical protein
MNPPPIPFATFTRAERARAHAVAVAPWMAVAADIQVSGYPYLLTFRPRPTMYVGAGD